jgi:hypothetical protein
MRLRSSWMDSALWTPIGVKWLKTTQNGLLDFKQGDITNIMLRMLLFLLCKFWGRIGAQPLPWPRNVQVEILWQFFLIRSLVLELSAGDLECRALLFLLTYTTSVRLCLVLNCTFCRGIANMVCMWNNACHSMSPKNNVHTMPSRILDIIVIEM